MMSSIEEESLGSPVETPSDLTFSHPDFDHADINQDTSTASPSPPTLIAHGSKHGPRGDRSLAQQALLNRALRNRRHTLANVLR